MDIQVQLSPSCRVDELEQLLTLGLEDLQVRAGVNVLLLERAGVNVLLLERAGVNVLLAETGVEQLSWRSSSEL